MGIRKESLIGGPNCIHLFILTLSLAKGENPRRHAHTAVVRILRAARAEAMTF
jgi:hypothetical protein